MTLLLQSLSTAAANSLATAIWQGLLLVIAVALFLRLLPRIPAAARSLIWTVVFALVLVLPFLPAHHSSVAGSISINPLWTLALAAIWLTLSLIRATQLLLSAFTLRRLARTSTPVQNRASSYSLCTSPLVDRPSVVGFFSRRILLPPELYASLTPAELEHVLLHETEHLRRRDDWTNLLQKLALVIVPLNPVLFWVERRLCLERELACDDRVLRATGAPRAYATCLTHLAEHSLLRRSLTLALGFFERQSELTRRVHRILLAPQQAMSPTQTFATTAALLIALAGGGVQLAHAPQLIHFAPATSQTAELQPMQTPASPSFTPSSSSTVRPTFVKAVLPTPAPSQRRLAAKPSVKRASHPQRPRTNTVRALQADFMERQAASPRRAVFATASNTRVSYTFVSAVAVAVPNGWIIFQL